MGYCRVGGCFKLGGGDYAPRLLFGGFTLPAPEELLPFAGIFWMALKLSYHNAELPVMENLNEVP